MHVGLVQSPEGPLLLSPGSQCTRDFVCARQEWGLSISQSCGSPAIKSRWPSRSDSLGISVTLPDPQAGKPDVGLRTFTAVGELLWYYFCTVCGSPTWRVWDLIFIVIAPLLPSYCGFSFVFGHGESFLVGSSILLLLMAVHQLQFQCSHQR